MSTFRQPASPVLMAGAAERTVFQSGLRGVLAPGRLPAQSLGPRLLRGLPGLSPRAPAPGSSARSDRVPTAFDPVACEPLSPSSLQLNTLQNGDLASPSSWGPFGVGPLQRKPALFLRFRAMESVVAVGVGYRNKMRKRNLRDLRTWPRGCRRGRLLASRARGAASQDTGRVLPAQALGVPGPPPACV